MKKDRSKSEDDLFLGRWQTWTPVYLHVYGAHDVSYFAFLTPTRTAALTHLAQISRVGMLYDQLPQD